MNGTSSAPARLLNVFVYEPYPLAKVFGNLRTLLYILEGASSRSVRCVVAAPFESELADRVRAFGADWLIVEPPDAINRYGGQVLREPMSQRVRALVELVGYNLRVRRLLQDRKIDLVYCNSIRSLLTVGLAAKLAKVPLVWYVKGALENRVLDRLGFFMADRIIYFCEANRDDRYPVLVRWFSRKIDIVRIGLDLAALDAIQAPTAPMPAVAEGELSVAYLGQLYAPKGVHFLVDAFAQVAKTFPKAKLYLIGDPGIAEYAHYVDELRARVDALGIADRVVFTGWRQDALAIAKQMTILVHPSMSEGFGRAVLEAMALGKPVIACAVGGLREAIQDGQNGFLVPPGDTEAIAARLRLLLSNAALRARMGRAARETVERDYQISDKLDELCDIWHDIVEHTVAPA